MAVDLREYDIEDLCNEIGVIFQDFMRYEMTARENIGVGRVELMNDDRQHSQRLPKRVWRTASSRSCSMATSKCSAGDLRAESICRVASGRRSLSPEPTCGKRRC